MPVVISVILFIFYYVIENTGTKMAREGELQMWFGMWVSTMVLAPLGAFFTYKANRDSVVFNIDVYKEFFMKLLGMRSKRHLVKKEVIIDDPDYEEVCKRLEALCPKCEEHAAHKRFNRPPNYLHIFTNNTDDTTIQEISDELESIVEILSNSKDRILIDRTNKFPILSVSAHKSPSKHLWLNVVCGVCVPVGIVFYLRIWMFGRRLDKDLRTIVETSGLIIKDLRN